MNRPPWTGHLTKPAQLRADTTTTRRESWSGQPRQLEDVLLMRKGALIATGELWTHQLGWECRLFAGEEMIATQVCRSEDDVTAFRDVWRAALSAKGWAER